MTRLIISMAFVLFWSLQDFAQGTFQNLDFEDANIVPIAGQPYAVTVANALPGWTVDYGATQQSQVTYNDESLGGTSVTVLANGYPTLTTFTPIDGNISVIVFAGLYEGQPAAATISQTGQIPVGTQSVFFDVGLEGAPFFPNASIGNNVLTLFPVGTGVSPGGMNYSIYGADVAPWAGQTEQLSISAPIGSGGFEIDDISFSPGAVPEPGALTLMGIGGLVFGLYRRFWKIGR